MKTLTFAVAILSLMMGCTDTSPQESPTSFRFTTTLTDDGIPFERYCGYLMKIGRGQVTFDDGESIPIVYLFFKDKEGKPSIVKTLYGDIERLSMIRANQYYDIGVRKYDEGFNFPRQLDVVKDCSGI